MGKWVRAVCWAASIWMLAQSLYLWGGLALTPVVGQQLRAQASMQSPLVATYLLLGRKALPLVGLDDEAAAHVAGRFPREIADAGSSPRQTVVHRFLAAQSAGEALDHYGGPLMLVLSLVLHLRRQKPIRSFGVRD